jgi:hypothetical protein
MEIFVSTSPAVPPDRLLWDNAGVASYCYPDACRIAEEIAERGGRAQVWDGDRLLEDFYRAELDDPPPAPNPDEASVLRAIRALIGGLCALRGFPVRAAPYPDPWEDHPERRGLRNEKPSPMGDVERVTENGSTPSEPDMNMAIEVFWDFYRLAGCWGRLPPRRNQEAAVCSLGEILTALQRAVPQTEADLALAFTFRALLHVGEAEARDEIREAALWIARAEKRKREEEEGSSG